MGIWVPNKTCVIRECQMLFQNNKPLQNWTGSAQPSELSQPLEILHKNCSFQNPKDVLQQGTKLQQIYPARLENANGLKLLYEFSPA